MKISKKIRLYARALYIKHLPYFIREKLLLIKNDYYIKLRSEILKYYKTHELKNIDSEMQEILRVIKKQKDLPVIPYDYINKYHPLDVKVFKDEGNGFSYVFHYNKKLYFKRDWNELQIQKYYNSLRIEQDELSPHCYFTDSFKINKDEVVVDIGTAEGNFSLDIIEKVKHIYMIEGDEEWIEALKLTFKPWIDKVTIIHKFIGESDNGQFISLNQLMPYLDIDFMKVDIEGWESSMLKGSSLLLNNRKIKKITICTYHKQEDYDRIDSILKSSGYITSHSSGYMIYKYDKNICPPYVRRGLIRATLN
jgi:hypothetical protein